MARPPTYQEQELLDQAWSLQLQFPSLSESAICGKLHVGKEYLADRSKDSEAIRALRSKMAAVRQAAWEEMGAKLMISPSASISPVVYIWMTRNILGWRNDPDAREVTEKKPKALAYRLDDTPHAKPDSSEDPE